MRILIIGATGYIGTSVSAAVRARGHQVIGSARSAHARSMLTARGDAAVAADVGDSSSVVAAAREADAVIYAVAFRASPERPDPGVDAVAVERGTLDALVAALADSGKPFIYTSGAWYYGPTGDRPADEDTPPNPPAIVAKRPELERIVLASASRGVRAIIIRPGDVYGRAGGLPTLFVDSARRIGAAQYIGDGMYRWPVVHVDDLGELYALAIERADAGAVFNAADSTSYRVKEIAEAASRGAGADSRTASWPLDAARAALGPLADALVMDQRLTSDRARKLLGWRIRPTTILDDLEHGSYAQAAAATRERPTESPRASAP
jgi:nucleoside-diphosphate-sugar epimerase